VRALGLDTGLACFGWAIADVGEEPRCLALGVIRTAKDPRKVLLAIDNYRRAQHVVRGLAQALELYPDIGVVCAETISFVRNASTMAQIGYAWGIVAALLERHDPPLALLQASPQEIKAACCPKIKNASKLDVQEALEGRFGHSVRGQLLEYPKTLREHPADALGAIVACLNRDEMRLAKSARRERQRSIEELIA
jgi:Holliday junction resolvasome RuvABC endonuclease subunit